MQQSTSDMPMRLSDFIQWVQNDQYKLEVQNALRLHPDFANFKDSVSFNCLLLS